jgi:hypothetical protein
MSLTSGLLFIFLVWLAVQRRNSKRFVRTRAGIMKTLFPKTDNCLKTDKIHLRCLRCVATKETRPCLAAKNVREIGFYAMPFLSVFFSSCSGAPYGIGNRRTITIGRFGCKFVLNFVRNALILDITNSQVTFIWGLYLYRSVACCSESVIIKICWCCCWSMLSLALSSAGGLFRSIN